MPLRLRPWWTALLLTIGFTLAVGAYYGYRPLTWGNFGTYDWLAYWSTPRAALVGNGFFDAAWMRQAQEAQGYTVTQMGPNYVPIWRLWNPPFVTLFWLPMASLPFTVSAYVWNGLSLFLFIGSALFLNRVSPRSVPDTVMVALAGTVLPIYDTLHNGQMGLLLGALLGFAWLAQRHGHSVAAGLLLVVQMVKPQILWIPVGLILWVAWRQHQTRTLAAFFGGILVLIGAAFLLDSQWLQAWLTAGAPTRWISFSLIDLIQGALYLPPWVRYSAPLIGSLVAVWRFGGRDTVTMEDMSEAAVISFFSSPYCWRSDLPAILVAVVWMVSLLWQDRRWRGGLLGFAVASVAISFAPFRLGYWFYFPTMLLFSLLWFQARRMASHRATTLGVQST